MGEEYRFAGEEAGWEYRALCAREYSSLRFAGVSGVDAREYHFAVEDGGDCGLKIVLCATGYVEEAVCRGDAHNYVN